MSQDNLVGVSLGFSRISCSERKQGLQDGGFRHSVEGPEDEGRRSLGFEHAQRDRLSKWLVPVATRIATNASA